MLQAPLFSILLILGGLHKLILKIRNIDEEIGEDRFFGKIVNVEEYPIGNTLFAIGGNCIAVLIIEYALFFKMINLNSINLPLMATFFTIFLIFAIIPWGLIYFKANNKSIVYILSLLFILLLFIQTMLWDNAVSFVVVLNMFNLPTIAQGIGDVIINIAKWLIFLILTIITLKNLKESKKMKKKSHISYAHLY